MSFINVGYGNFVVSERIIAIVYPDSAPLKRNLNSLREENKVTDVTYGKPTQSIIYLDNGQVVLSSLHPDTLVRRYDAKK